MDEDSSSALCEKLEKLYLAKSLTTMLHLKRQLYKLKMDDGENFIDHISVFNGRLYQLWKVYVNIEKKIRPFYFVPHFSIHMKSW